MRTRNHLAIGLAAGALAALGGCASEQPNVTYTKDIRPILEQHCVRCHVPGGKGYEASGLSMASYETLMEGTRLGPVIIPGNSVSSTLVLLLEGKADPSIKMPHGTEEPLPEKQIALFRQWIDAGAPR